MTRDELIGAVAGVKSQTSVYAADLEAAQVDQAFLKQRYALGADDMVAALITSPGDLARLVKDTPALATKPADLARTPQDNALDGQAWHVFNTLRGAADVITLDDGATVTFEDVRALLAGGK